MYAPDEDIEVDEERDDPVPDRVTWRADEDDDAAAARARRRLEMAHALAEMSLRMAAAVEARAVAAMEAPEPAPDPLFGDVGLVFTRVMRAARLSLSLEARLDEEQRASARVQGVGSDEDPNDPYVMRLTKSQQETLGRKFDAQLAAKRMGDLYNVIGNVIGVEAVDLDRVREVEPLLFKAKLWDVLEEMSKADNFINRDMGDLMIEAADRAGLELGHVFDDLPDPRLQAAADIRVVKDRDHPS